MFPLLAVGRSWPQLEQKLMSRFNRFREYWRHLNILKVYVWISILYMDFYISICII